MPLCGGNLINVQMNGTLFSITSATGKTSVKGTMYLLL